MPSTIVVTGTRKKPLLHVEGDVTQVTTGGDGLGFDGWAIGTEPTDVPPDAVKAFGLLDGVADYKVDDRR